MNPMSLELTRQLAHDRATELRRHAGRRRTVDVTDPVRPRTSRRDG